MLILLRHLSINIILVLSLLAISSCSSSEDKANKFYENGMYLLEKGELVKANVEFRNAQQLNGKMTKAIWGQVLVAEKQGKPRLQYKLLNTVLTNDPGHIQALVKLGRLLLIAGQLDKALEMSDLSMKINQQDLSVLSLRAAIMLKLDDVTTAVKLAKYVVSKDPYYIDALVVLATERLTSGDADKAIQFVNQGLEVNNKNIALQLIKIKALENLKKPDLAEHVLKNLSNDYPKVVGFKTVLAQFYLKYNRIDDAEKIYQLIVKNNPKNLNAKIKLVKFLHGTKGESVALKQLQTYSEQDPSNNEIKFVLFQLYFSRKEIDQANVILNSIINENKGSEDARKAKGIKAAYLLENGDKKAAEEIIDTILAEDKLDRNGLILKASIDIDRQKYDKAIGALRLLLRNSPDSSRALYFLAKAYSLSGSTELADKQYLKAFKASKFNAAYGLSYAKFLLKRKEYHRAEKILQDILSFSGNNLSAMKLLAQTRLHLRDWVGAQKVADVMKRIGGENNISNQISSAILLSKKDYRESIELLKKDYQSTPENIQSVTALVRTYMVSGREHEAASFLDAVINASPENYNARVLRAQVYLYQGNKKQAINTYKDIIKNDSLNAVSYYHLAMIYMREKQFNEASIVLNNGLSVMPDNFSLRITQAGLYEKTAQADMAIKIYEQLIKERPDADIVANNLASLLTDSTDKTSFDKAYTLSQRFKQSYVPQFKDTFGWASYRVGKYSDAKVLLKSVVEQMPGVPDFHYHLGMIHLATNNKVLAKKELENALSLAGEEPFAKTVEIREILGKL